MSNIVDTAFGIGSGDAALILGDIEFGHMEVPDFMNFGGDQLMSVHTLVGGKRIINTLGRADADITWSGFFFGEFASERARAVDFLRSLGTQVELFFGEFLYLVVIKSFNAQLERVYQIPYSITLTVVQNLSIPVPFPVPNGYNDAVNNDMSYSQSHVGATGSPSLQTALNDTQTAINNAGNLTTSTPDQINAILDNIYASQVITAQIISSSSLIPLNSLQPHYDPYAISQQFSAINAAYEISFALDRMEKNIGLINNGLNAKYINVSDTTLYQVAAEEYQDATLWTYLADVNNLIDPDITTNITLVIPPKPSNAVRFGT